MENRDERQASRRELWIAIALIVWRLAAGSPAEFWRDWILIAAAFWIFTRYQSHSRAWPVAAATVMAYLLGIYLVEQLPHALAMFGIGL